MFAIIISFTIIASGAHGEGVMTDQKFATMAECEAARPPRCSASALRSSFSMVGCLSSHAAPGRMRSIIRTRRRDMPTKRWRWRTKEEIERLRAALVELAAAELEPAQVDIGTYASYQACSQAGLPFISRAGNPMKTVKTYTCHLQRK